MCSYNRINGNYSCGNNETLNTDYKVRAGFEGWVMSDWGATHSMSINRGLDQEMPGGHYMGAGLLVSVHSPRSRCGLSSDMMALITSGCG